MSEIYLPNSYLAQKATEVEKAADYGPGFGPPVVLGPGGAVANFMNNKRSNRFADKSLYYYLYTRHPIVYACVELIVQTAAQDRHTYPSNDRPRGLGTLSGDYGEYRGSERDEDNIEGDLGDEPNDGVEFLERFFAEVNDFESFGDLLAGVYRDVLISGEAFILKQRMGARVVVGSFDNPGDGENNDTTGRVTRVVSDPSQPVVCLHRIPSRDTTAIPGPDGYPALYKQKGEGGSYREYSVDDVIFIALPDPADPSRGLSPLEALDLSLATDVSAAKYNESYFRNGAKAGMVFAAQSLSPEEIRRNKEWINVEYVKPENAHKPMLLLGNIELVRDGNKAQQDMDFIELRRFTREDISAVYSVPLSKLLHESGGLGQAGKLSDDMTFRADTVGPLQTKVYAALNRQLMRKEFPGFPLLIPPRQEKVRLDLLEAAKSLVACGGTGNEARAILHLPEIPHPTMDLPLFLVPGLQSLITDETAQQQTKSGGGALVGGHATDAGRADRTSKRTSRGQGHARAQSGRGMSTRKAEVEGEE